SHYRRRIGQRLRKLGATGGRRSAGSPRTLLLPLARTNHSTRCTSCHSRDVRAARVCRGRWSNELRRECGRLVPSGRRLRRSHSQTREASRPASHAANQVRAGAQPQDRQGARPPSARQAACSRRRGGRVMGWLAPLRHLSAKLLSDRISSEREPSMGEVTTIGFDLAKHVFQVHGVDAEGATVLRKQLRRAQVLAFFGRLPPCLVGLEACATAHYWARELRALGHEVRLMPAQYVKAYIK